MSGHNDTLHVLADDQNINDDCKLLHDVYILMKGCNENVKDSKQHK